MSEHTEHGGKVSRMPDHMAHLGPTTLVLGPTQRNGFAQGTCYLSAAASSDAGYDALVALVAPHTLVDHRSYAQDRSRYYVTFEVKVSA